MYGYGYGYGLTEDQVMEGGTYRPGAMLAAVPPKQNKALMWGLGIMGVALLVGGLDWSKGARTSRSGYGTTNREADLLGSGRMNPKKKRRSKKRR